LRNKSPKLTIALLLLCFELTAQNHLYTSEQFGIYGSMLGGAVTAGTDDVSMMYYNPASIHQVSPQFNVSFIQPAVRFYGFKDFWRNGDPSNLNTSIGLKPTLISFKVKIKKLDIAFLRLNKSEFSDEFLTKQEITNNNLLTTRFFDYEYSGRDNWFGIGANLKLKENLYIGWSQFMSSARFSYKKNSLFEEINLAEDNQLIRYTESDFDGAYSNFGFISKIGVVYNADRHDFGFTITTPKYFRFIKGGDVFNANLNTENGETTLDQIIDTDISPVIKTPWEFNLGYSFTITNSQIFWVSTSFHAGIDEYTMTEKVNTIGSISWKNGSKSVMNLALGYSHEVNENLQLSGGIRTNNFAYENKPVLQGTFRNTILDGNHMHFVFGSKINFKKNTILLGMDYGKIRNIPNEAGFQEVADVEMLDVNLSNLRKSSISILLTYRFIINGIKNMIR